MKYTYVPKSDVWEGAIEIDVPPYRERIKLLQSMSVEAEDGSGEVSRADEMKTADTMLEMISSRVLSCNLKHSKSGVTVENWEDATCYYECSVLTSELRDIVLNGIRLGED